MPHMGVDAAPRRAARRVLLPLLVLAAAAGCGDAVPIDGRPGDLAQATTAARDALAARLRSAGTRVRRGAFSVVSPLPGCPVKDASSCATPPASSPTPFPGR